MTEKFDSEEIIQKLDSSEDEAYLDPLKDALYNLSQGLWVQKETIDGLVKVYKQPPDLKGLQYLIEKKLDKTKKQLDDKAIYDSKEQLERELTAKRAEIESLENEVASDRKKIAGD